MNVKNYYGFGFLHKFEIKLKNLILIKYKT